MRTHFLRPGFRRKDSLPGVGGGGGEVVGSTWGFQTLLRLSGARKVSHVGCVATPGRTSRFPCSRSCRVLFSSRQTLPFQPCLGGGF